MTAPDPGLGSGTTAASSSVATADRTATLPRPHPSGAGGWVQRLQLPVGRWGLRCLAFLYLGVLVLLPLSAVIVRGFGDGLTDLKAAFNEPGAWHAIELTLLLAAATALVNAFFGTIVAWVLTRYRFAGRGLLSAVVDVPFAVPTLVTGVMLRALYGPNSPIGSFLGGHGIQVVFAPLGILFALVFVTLPLVVRTVQPVVLELDLAEEEASHVLGAGRWTTFRRVVLPHLRPAIVAGSLLAFARALGEFGAIVIVSGNILNKTLTAPVFIFQLISQFKPAEAAAVATLLFALSFVLVLITEKLVAAGQREVEVAEP